jgi:hypothetical protein
MIGAVRARIEGISAAEDASWGAFAAIIINDHGEEWGPDWTGYPHSDPPSSTMVINAPGVGEPELRIILETAVEAVNEAAHRDPLNSLRQISPTRIQYLE